MDTTHPENNRHMGIYMTLLPCGCEIESYLGYDSSSVCFACVAHGGNPIVVAGRQAKRWKGPENPYANPEACDAPAVSSLQIKNGQEQPRNPIHS